MNDQTLGWCSVIRLGLVQTAIGSIAVLTTSTLNRIMVVEMALPASLPAALVAWHYAVQLSRPRWGHGSDTGQRRTPWIIGGMGILALGAILSANATIALAGSTLLGILLGIVAFTMIGVGIAASGTSLLALMATRVEHDRRPAAAAIAWVMMIVGIVLTAGIAGRLLDPFSSQRLALVASAIAGFAFLVTIVAVTGIESSLAPGNPESTDISRTPAAPFVETIRHIWREKLAREFTIFVFISMLAYSAQELILEPYAGLVFGYSVGQSTQLAGIQHGGVLLGMVLLGLSGTLVRGDKTALMKQCMAVGCVASAAALVGLAAAGFAQSRWPLEPMVFALGFANGIFAVSAIGSMMSLVSAGGAGRQGIRMGLWGAAQAVAFALGGVVSSGAVDLARPLLGSTPASYGIVFVAQAVLFLFASVLAASVGAQTRRDEYVGIRA